MTVRRAEMAEDAAPQQGGEDARDQVRPFAAFLHDQRGGVLHSELSEALAEVSQAVMLHNKGGKVTLTISVKPAGNAEHTVFIGDDVKVQVPQAEKPTSMFFVDDEGNVSRRDPRQAELPLKEVPVADQKPPTELRRAAQDG
jgi:hypothetical protein